MRRYKNIEIPDSGRGTLYGKFIIIAIIIIIIIIITITIITFIITIITFIIIIHNISTTKLHLFILSRIFCITLALITMYYDAITYM